MKIFFSIIIAFLNSTILYSQSNKIVFDTSSNKLLFNSSIYYSKTDFSKVDTIELWNYELDDSYKGQDKDTIKAIAQLHFWRTVPIDDKISYGIYGRYWTPN